MEKNKLAEALLETARVLDKCSDDVPYEISARKSIYFRMEDMAKEARALVKDMSEG